MRIDSEEILGDINWVPYVCFCASKVTEKLWIDPTLFKWRKWKSYYQSFLTGAVWLAGGASEDLAAAAAAALAARIFSSN